MRTRKLGKTDIEVSELGLGTWSLSGDGYGPVAPDVARATINAALDEGVTLIDVSAAYGGSDGPTEKLLGEVIAERGRDKVVLCLRVGVDRSVIPAKKRFDRGALVELTDKSLKRLGVEHVDVLLLHNPLASTLERSPEALDTLAVLRERGKCRAMGVSAGSVDVVREALRQSVDVMMVPYNILAPRLVHATSMELTKHDVGVIARSPLSYGILADTWHADRRFPDGDHRYNRWALDELARRIRQREVLRYFVHDQIASMREAALRYVLVNNMIDAVVVGARTAEMAKENAHAADTLPYLDDADLASIGKRMSEEGIEF